MNSLIAAASTDKFDIFEELLGATASDMSASAMVWTVIVRLAFALLIALFIYVIYKFTFSGVTFNRNFGGTIVITTLVTALIMMIINSNLALSLGMVGALSIIRFRNAVKDSRDIAFIFWSVAAGLAAGTGLYPIAFIATIFIGAFVVVFNLLGFSQKSYLLIVKTKSDYDSQQLGKLLNHYCKKFRVRMKNTSGEAEEMIYELNLNRGADDVLVEKISAVTGVLSVNLVAGNEEV